MLLKAQVEREERYHQQQMEMMQTFVQPLANVTRTIEEVSYSERRRARDSFVVHRDAVRFCQMVGANSGAPNAHMHTHACIHTTYTHTCTYTGALSNLPALPSSQPDFGDRSSIRSRSRSHSHSGSRSPSPHSPRRSPSSHHHSPSTRSSKRRRHR